MIVYSEQEINDTLFHLQQKTSKLLNSDQIRLNFRQIKDLLYCFLLMKSYETVTTLFISECSNENTQH